MNGEIMAVCAVREELVGPRGLRGRERAAAIRHLEREWYAERAKERVRTAHGSHKSPSTLIHVLYTAIYTAQG